MFSIKYEKTKPISLPLKKHPILQVTAVLILRVSTHSVFFRISTYKKSAAERHGDEERLQHRTPPRILLMQRYQFFAYSILLDI